MMDENDAFLHVFTGFFFSVVLMDEQGTLLFLNPSARTLLGYQKNETLGQNIQQFLPSSLAKNFHGSVKDFFKKNKKNKVMTGQELDLVRKDGLKVSVLVSVHPVRLTTGPGYSAIIKTIIKKKEKKQECFELLDFLNTLSAPIFAQSAFKDIAQHMVKKSVEHFLFSLGHMYEFCFEKKELQSSGVFYSLDPENHKTLKKLTLKSFLKKNMDLARTSWKQKKLVCFHDVDQENICPGRKTTKNLNIKDGVAFPLFFNGLFFGTLEFYSSDVRKPSRLQKKKLMLLQKMLGRCYGLLQKKRPSVPMLQSRQEAVLGFDCLGTITSANPQAEELLGYGSGELVGASVQEIMFHGCLDAAQDFKKKCHNHDSLGTAKTHQTKKEVFCRKDGTKLPVCCTRTPVFDQEKCVGFLIHFINRTQRSTLESMFKDIFAIQEAYLREKEHSRVFDKILSCLLSLTNSEHGFVGVVFKNDKDLNDLTIHATTHIAWNKATKPLVDSALKKGEFVISNHLKEDPRFKGEVKEGSKIRRFLGVPVLGGAGLVGMCGLANSKSPYSEKMVQEIQPMIHFLSGLIEFMNNESLVKKMMERDPLTQLLNRVSFEKKLQEHMMSAKKGAFALVMIGLSNFKNTNDRYGYRLGDALLCGAADRLKSTFQEESWVARMGGDEFALVFRGKKPSNIESTLKKIMMLFQDPFVLSGQFVVCEVKVGVAFFPESGKDAFSLVKQVDLAMQQAKKSTHPWVVCSKEMKKKLEQERFLKEEIIGAFERKEFFLMLQPQWHMSLGRIHGFEALLRWNRPGFGLVLPGVFVSVLEQNGFAERLNSYVLDLLLDCVKKYKKKQRISLSFNVSPLIENLENHLHDLVNRVEKSKPPSHILLEFEITESSFLHKKKEKYSMKKNLFERLKRNNIRLAIDDFGVEHSSINRLLQYPFNTVKIDLFFTQKLTQENNKATKAVVRAILGLSDDLGFDVIAEGAETEQQVTILQDLGCTMIQGNYFYKPMKVDQALALLGKD